jgi:hypothetical protein
MMNTKAPLPPLVGGHFADDSISRKRKRAYIAKRCAIVAFLPVFSEKRKGTEQRSVPWSLLEPNGGG